MAFAHEYEGGQRPCGAQLRFARDAAIPYAAQRAEHDGRRQRSDSRTGSGNLLGRAAAADDRDVGRQLPPRTQVGVRRRSAMGRLVGLRGAQRGVQREGAGHRPDLFGEELLQYAHVPVRRSVPRLRLVDGTHGYVR